ncbi:MAG: hypothetical protein ABR540_04500 [Acidimicrobiales bacterium]|nr:hypothetical protein [Actinomycetota bacterium]
MSLASIVTLVGVGLIVAVLALYLITVSWILYRVYFTLGTVIIGVKSICHQVSVVPKYVGIIMNDVLAIDQAAKQLLAWGGEPEDMIEDPRIARMTLQLQDVDDEEEMAAPSSGPTGAERSTVAQPAMR